MQTALRNYERICWPSIWFVLVCAFLTIALPIGAQNPLPKINSHVTDLTNTLTSEQRDALESQLSSFEENKGSQLILVIIPTTGSEAIEQYGIRLADSLKVGRKKIDDGAIVLIAKDDHSVRIEVGYGLEGVLTDYACKRIIESYFVPNFRNGDYYGGIRSGLEAMISLIQGEQLPAPDRSQKHKVSVSGILPVLFIIGFFLRTIFGRILGGFLTGGAIFFVTWIALGTISIAILFSIISFFMIISGIGGTGMGYRSGGFRMGGGFGDTHNSGGFSGGGGSFGGGGASGKW